MTGYTLSQNELYYGWYLGESQSFIIGDKVYDDSEYDELTGIILETNCFDEFLIVRGIEPGMELKEILEIISKVDIEKARKFIERLFPELNPGNPRFYTPL